MPFDFLFYVYFEGLECTAVGKFKDHNTFMSYWFMIKGKVQSKNEGKLFAKLYNQFSHIPYNFQTFHQPLYLMKT